MNLIINRLVATILVSIWGGPAWAQLESSFVELPITERAPASATGEMTVLSEEGAELLKQGHPVEVDLSVISNLNEVEGGSHSVLTPGSPFEHVITVKEQEAIEKRVHQILNGTQREPSESPHQDR
ncbi:MAG: hypothetical protein KDD61_10525 [Bdellovibrionales bacterium]|nr:hypothetical protein [Bdellovibrionales bacterium]